MASDVKKILKRFKAAESNKQRWKSILDDCYEYAMPEREALDNGEQGQEVRENLFDSTAPDALEDFATRMESELVPPNMEWIKLESGSEVPEEEQEAIDTYLEETTSILFDHISSSNFSSQIHEAFLDLGISTGAVIVESGDGIQSALNFRCVSLSELYLERSRKGTLDTVFRKITIPASDVMDIWPRAKISDTMQHIIMEKPTEDISFIEGVMPTDDGKFNSFVLYEKESHLLIDEVLESNPWVVFRESTIPGEVYGRGRVMRALPDIKTLNKMVEDHLRAAAFISSPTYTAADDGVINPYTINLEPGQVIPVGSNSNENPTLRALPSAGDYNVLQYDIRALQDNVRRILISKPFGNVEETPVRTATEMSIRNADMAKTSLGASGRIQNELLETLVARCVYLLKKAGKIADFRVDGREVAIKFTSPSSRQQDEYKLAGIGRAMEMMMALPPELVMEQIAIEKIPGEIIDTLGLPATYKRTKEEQAMRQQQRQQQEAMMRQQAAAQVENKNGGQ